ncbi:MAG: DUF5054 domain-containing protein [Eubacterium sp.]
MKKIFVVSKTHLDLGFTDYAENIRQKYIHTFIPDAINLAEEVNTQDKKYFIWTTGSWILKEALENSDKAEREHLIKAIENGNIVAHAMPFTTHTELLDYDTLDYGLSIVDELDKIRNRKTVSAKMTDVPGHTKGLVKLLAQHGIKLLHIGVNGASAIPEVPECFLWKSGEYEVVVIYSGDYGGAFQSDLLEEVLYFDHTLDNHGAPSPEKVKSKFKQIQEQYPDYEVTAGTMDDFAEVIWQVRQKLPVLEEEIGDTWIHGSASDPYKSASLRELMRLKREWLNDGSMEKGSDEYNGFSDALLCISEHTCGMDSKMHFADYENYLKKDFQKARQEDRVKIRHIFRDFPHNFLTAVSRIGGGYEKGSYKNIEKSWLEQRAYINKAVSSLNAEHKSQAEKVLACLIPKNPQILPKGKQPYEQIACGDWKFELNKNGGIGFLSFGDDEIIRRNNEPIIDYCSYTEKDYQYWLKQYARNLKQTAGWAVGDFARPLLKYVKGKYPSGRFHYYVDEAVLSADNQNKPKIFVNLKCDKELCEKLGAPRLIQLIYSLDEQGLTMELSWFEKDANRLTEAIYMHLFPSSSNIKFRKIDDIIDPFSIASMGGRNLNAVYDTQINCDNGIYKITNYDSPIVSMGRGKILKFDNIFENPQKDGISYLLYNNVWGTNFPLWYEDNAVFKFTIKRND